MEDVIDLYEEDYDPLRPVICVDERPCQLTSDVVEPIEMEPGKPERQDYEYERKGTCNVFIAFEPLTGQRFLEVRERRTKIDYACFMEQVAANYPEAEVIRVVQDNLNTHTAGSFYKKFPPEVAHILKNKFEFHYTPKKGSWLNMAEIEFSALSRQCLNRRIGDIDTFKQQTKAWEQERNAKEIKVNWRFTKNDAHKKLKRHYSIVKN